MMETGVKKSAGGLKIPTIGANVAYLAKRMLANPGNPQTNVFLRAEWEKLLQTARWLENEANGPGMGAAVLRVGGARLKAPLGNADKSRLFVELAKEITKANGARAYEPQDEAYVSSSEAVLMSMFKDLKGMDALAPQVVEAVGNAQKIGLLMDARINDSGSYSTC